MIISMNLICIGWFRRRILSFFFFFSFVRSFFLSILIISWLTASTLKLRIRYHVLFLSANCIHDLPFIYYLNVILLTRLEYVCSSINSLNRNNWTSTFPSLFDLFRRYWENNGWMNAVAAHSSNFLGKSMAISSLTQCWSSFVVWYQKLSCDPCNSWWNQRQSSSTKTLN